MYRRHVAGGPRGGGAGGIVTFAVFCCLVVWLVPYCIEALAGHPVELFMVPPPWRGGVMCDPGPDNRTYAYAGGRCVRVCGAGGEPGCVPGEPGKPYGPDVVAGNLAAGRSALGLYDAYSLVFTAVRYGAVLAAACSICVLRARPARGFLSEWRDPASWACVPCFVAAPAAALEPSLLAAAPPVWAAAAGADLRSTARFGRPLLLLHETNPLLRCMLRRTGLRRAFAAHVAVCVAALLLCSVALGAAGPLGWDALLGALAFGCAGAHLWAAASNSREYGRRRGGG